MSKERNIKTFTADWQGIALSISYETRWLDLESANVAHLQIKSVSRERLPITETGYRSHFLAPEEVADAGGPVAYALAWLDHMAQSKEWKAYAQAAQQLSLF